MRPFKLLLLGFLISTLISCEDDEKVDSVDLKIVNYSDKKIDLIYFTTIHNEAKTRDNSVEPNSTLNTKFDFVKVAKSDGSYSLYLKYANSNDTTRENFGYYTNGYPLDSEFTINIYNDSIRINGKTKDLSPY